MHYHLLGFSFGRDTGPGGLRYHAAVYSVMACVPAWPGNMASSGRGRSVGHGPALSCGANGLPENRPASSTRAGLNKLIVGGCHLRKLGRTQV